MVVGSLNSFGNQLSPLLIRALCLETDHGLDVDGLDNHGQFCSVNEWFDCRVDFPAQYRVVQLLNSCQIVVGLLGQYIVSIWGINPGITNTNIKYSVAQHCHLCLV